MKVRMVWVAAAAACCCAGFAQSSAEKPAFEVASIKPAKPMPMGQMRIMMGADAGMLRYSNVSLKDCIRTAYRVKDFQVEGPDWINGARFDIVAKLPAGASQDRIPEMLQTLLEERFKLQTHRDTKDHAIYAMVAAKGGPKLTPAEIATEATPDPSPDGGKNGPPRTGPAGPPRAGMMMQVDPAGVHLKAPSATLGMLAEMISRFTERPVVDMTGIEGRYNFDLVFAPETMRGMRVAMGGPMPPPPGGEHAPADAPAEKGASIYESVGRYGLKLEPKKGPLEMLVVDHIEREPTEN